MNPYEFLNDELKQEAAEYFTTKQLNSLFEVNAHSFYK